jgi:hypothetical protein
VTKAQIVIEAKYVIYTKPRHKLSFSVRFLTEKSVPHQVKISQDFSETETETEMTKAQFVTLQSIWDIIERRR